MSRCLLVGEGVSETGWDAREGFLSRLLGQLAGEHVPALAAALGSADWEAVCLPDLTYRTGVQLAQDVQLRPPQPHGMARVAARAIRAAHALQCDAVVVIIDSDHRPERRTELAAGLADCELPSAHAAATETLEAWIIADPQVLSPHTIAISKPPESIWGTPRDPDGEHPKNVLRKALVAAHVEYPDVLEEWSVARAVVRAPRLCDFCAMIVGNILSNQGLCRPTAWDME